MTKTGKTRRLFIARHGETVFNAVHRMQGQKAVHTPLTRLGFAQADEMGRALSRWIGPDHDIVLCSSTAGRALQTLAIIAEHINADWHQVEADDRLQEIDVGDWSERTYAEIAAESGPIVDLEHHLFSMRPPGGEYYEDVAARLSSWIADNADQPDDLVILMHGMSARVLRGLLLGLPVDPRFGAPIAPSLSQGSMAMIQDGIETIIIDGDGAEERG
jgi:glucosyl-3-phosphoglycerate phosphatase